MRKQDCLKGQRSVFSLSLMATTDTHMYSVITINIFITTCCIHINTSLFSECILSEVYTLCVLLGSKVMNQISMFTARPSDILVACAVYGPWSTVKMDLVYCTFMYNSMQNTISLVYKQQTLYTLSYHMYTTLTPSCLLTSIFASTNSCTVL